MSAKNSKTKPVFSLKLLAEAAKVKMPVELNHPSVGAFSITFDVKTMPKSAWAALRDKHAAEENKDVNDGDELKFVEFIAEHTERAVALIMEFAEGWSLEEAMTKEALCELDDVCGNAFVEILRSYSDSVFLGKLGNSAK